MDRLPNELLCKIFILLEKEVTKVPQINKSLNKIFNPQKNYIAYHILRPYNPQVIYEDSYTILKYFVNEKLNLYIDVNSQGTYDDMWFNHYYSSLEVMRYLVQIDFDITHPDDEKYSMLVDICPKGNLEIVRYLVENGADVNYLDNEDCNSYDITPLESASDHLEMVKYLVEEGAIVNLKILLFLACKKCKLETFIYLLNHMGIQIVGITENIYTDFINWVIKHGVDISIDDCTALDIAVKNRHLDIVKYLVENGIDYDKIGILHIASKNNDLEIIKCLVEIGVKFKKSALHEAILNQNLEIVKYLVESGVDHETKESALTIAKERNVSNIELNIYLAKRGENNKIKENKLPQIIRYLIKMM
jgi:ankyrin repeat protein